MFVCNLITDPTAPRLGVSLVESLRSAWCGGHVKWLSPNEAAEFQVSTMPENFWDVWAEFQILGVDLIIQPLAGRRKAILLADMDSTMIQQECIDELAIMAGVGNRVERITARAMNGELDFEMSVVERVALLKGLPESIISEVLASRISFMPGGLTLLATMKANGAYAALVSWFYCIYCFGFKSPRF